MVDFQMMTREELQELAKCIKTTPEDLAYLDRHFPAGQPSVPDQRSTDDHDLYQTWLTVMAGLQPKTVKLLRKANAATDPTERAKIERDAVQAYFAELAHYWTEDAVKEWQRSNPVGTEWLCEFGRVLAGPKRKLDAVKYELALNWLRQKCNLLTAEELSRKIHFVTGKKIRNEAIKKQRERLGLATKRTPGPRPNSEK